MLEHFTLTWSGCFLSKSSCLLNPIKRRSSLIALITASSGTSPLNPRDLCKTGITENKKKRLTFRTLVIVVESLIFLFIHNSLPIHRKQLHYYISIRLINGCVQKLKKRLQWYYMHSHVCSRLNIVPLPRSKDYKYPMTYCENKMTIYNVEIDFT